MYKTTQLDNLNINKSLSEKEKAMDWYSWLSKTNLEPTYQYEYALYLAQNQLQEEDLAYFDHAFLQSIGIYVAKHRIEIVKLARKDVRGKTTGLWRFVLAMSKTRKLFSKNVNKLSFRKYDPYPVPQPSPARNSWFGTRGRINVMDSDQQKKMIVTKKVMKSGPLDRTGQDKSMVTSKNISVSGPLDMKALERYTYPNRSPVVMTPMDRRAKERMDLCRSPAVSFPVDGWRLSPNVNSETKSLWSLMFQDMKPT